MVSTVRIAAVDDVEARESAEALVDGHALELWQSLRFVEHFPVDAAGDDGPGA